MASISLRFFLWDFHRPCTVCSPHLVLSPSLALLQPHRPPWSKNSPSCSDLRAFALAVLSARIGSPEIHLAHFSPPSGLFFFLNPHQRTFFHFFVQIEWEEEREREKKHIDMKGTHARPNQRQGQTATQVDSCMCPDKRSNLQLWHMGMTL
uniref:Uncharacterized protein n=1 Tax=Molossus molossus TaxID=27622 RepID=A0A7J8C8M1_MOLMO|nr:hypothetical protein HJG59_009893 [Molossus molossus]